MPELKKDDVIIPRRSLKRKDWRGATITVVEQLEDGTIVAFPEHGGFRLRIPGDKALEYDFIKVPQEMLERSPFFKADFDADWMPEGKKYPGWTTGQLWNGWGTPSFEAPVARKVAADLSDGWDVTFDEKKEEYTLRSQSNPDEEVYVVPVETIRVQDKGRWKTIKVWSIGSGYFTWNAPDLDE
jgi:hypothetical protein